MPKQTTTPATPATLMPPIAPPDNEGELETGIKDVDAAGVEGASEVVTLDRKLDVGDGLRAAI
jgi:hypothetical protein